MAKTIYEIDINYNFKNAQSIATDFNQVANAAQNAEKKVIGFGGSLGGLAKYVGIGFLLNQGKKAFIDFNSELEQVGIATTTMIESIFRTTHDQSVKLAKSTRDELARFSRAAPGGMEDYFKGFQTLAPGLAHAKMTLSQMITMSENLTAASQVRGMGGQELLDQLRRAFINPKNVRNAGALSGFLSLGGSSVQEFRKMSDEKRIQTANKIALSRPFKNALAEQAESFDALWDSAKNSAQFAFAKIGEKLFITLKKSVSDFNKWFDKNEDAIIKWADDFSKTLVKGFNAIESSLQWIFANKDTLLSIAEAFVAFKIVGSIGGGIGKVTDNLSNLASKVNAVTAAFQILIGALEIASHKIDKDYAVGAQNSATLKEMALAGSNLQPGASIGRYKIFGDYAQQMGITPEKYLSNKEKIDKDIAKQINDGFYEKQAVWRQIGNPLSDAHKEFKDIQHGLEAWAANMKEFQGPIGRGGKNHEGHLDPTTKPPNIAPTVNNYNQINVQTGDPDLVAIQIADFLDKTSSNSLRGMRGR